MHKSIFQQLSLNSFVGHLQSLCNVALIACLVLMSAEAYARSSFAIVVDPRSAQEAKAELEQYAQLVENQNNWDVIQVIDRWGVPDSIRQELKRLYDTRQLVGCVFVGDIPIAMVRDAQYMTSAFKMNQSGPRKDTSVPSDRFYDDFGLSFKYLDKDTDGDPYFYYSLQSDGNQRLHPNIFSGRIRPTDAGGTSRYDKLRSYLKKVIAEKQRNNPINQIMFFTGHGSLSESRVAHMDEKVTLFEHFPWLKTEPNAISYIDYSDKPFIKEKMMDELMRRDLDLAILHHHGDYDTQYLSAYPDPKGTIDSRDLVLAYAREAIRKAEDPEAKRKELTAKYMLADSALVNWNDPEIVLADSIRCAKYNLTLPDFAGYGFKPCCKVVLFDACYNGSFHRDDCIANEYIFSEGENVVCVGGSVNILQDKWYDHCLGLLAQGLQVGRFNMLTPYLEVHVIGDPTYTFTPQPGAPKLSQMFDNPKANWSKLLSSANGDMQSLAIIKLAEQQKISSKTLLQLMKNSPDAHVRLQAMLQLCQMGGQPAIEAVKLGVNDNREMVQRFAANELRFNGSPQLIPSLISLMTRNNVSARVYFDATIGMSFFEKDLLMAELAKQVSEGKLVRVNPEPARQEIETLIENGNLLWEDAIHELCDGKMSEKKEDRYLDHLRIYCPHYLMMDLVNYAKSASRLETKVGILHALGWHTHSHMRPQLCEAILPMTTDTTLDPAVRAEATRTLKRLKGE